MILKYLNPFFEENLLLRCPADILGANAFVSRRPLPLAQVASSATGGAPIAPHRRPCHRLRRSCISCLRNHLLVMYLNVGAAICRPRKQGNKNGRLIAAPTFIPTFYIFSKSGMSYAVSSLTGLFSIYSHTAQYPLSFRITRSINDFCQIDCPSCIETHRFI